LERNFKRKKGQISGKDRGWAAEKVTAGWGFTGGKGVLPYLELKKKPIMGKKRNESKR